MKHSYIYSASSFNTIVEPPDAFFLMKCIQAKAGLASSYDIHKYKYEDNEDQYADFVGEIASFSKNSKVYIDSGNYESSRFNDESWTREKHIEAISELDKRYTYFTFDKYSHFKDEKEAVNEISISIDQLTDLGIGTTKIIPILHIIKPVTHKTHGFILSIISSLIDKYSIRHIAIPERDVGDGLVDKLQFISTLRKDIDSVRPNIKIHLLGTGNPLSMLLFHGMGVQSFDGLEWCRQSIDSDSALLFHPQQYDFLNNTFIAEDDRISELLNKKTLPYEFKIALHNACFMKKWDAMMVSNKMACVEIIKKFFPKNMLKAISKHILFNE